MGLVVLIFGVSQIYVIGQGCTANEKIKWDDFYRDMDDKNIELEKEGKPLLDKSKVVNKYDIGFFKNIYAALFPEKIHQFIDQHDKEDKKED